MDDKSQAISSSSCDHKQHRCTMVVFHQPCRLDSSISLLPAGTCVRQNTNKDNGKEARQACTQTRHGTNLSCTGNYQHFSHRRKPLVFPTEGEEPDRRVCVCVCVCECVSEREREIERELRRHQKSESGEGEAHTEKLLISRVTVMLPLNERNINTFSSFQGGFSALKSHPVQPSTAQHSPAQYSSVQPSPARPSPGFLNNTSPLCHAH